MTEKKHVSAKEVVLDIRADATDEFLMKKYSLTERELPILFKELVEAKVLTQAELDRRAASIVEVEAVISEPQARPDSLPPASGHPIFKCPACGLPQNYEFKVCPQCGIIVDKFLKEKSQAAGEGDGSSGKPSSPHTDIPQNEPPAQTMGFFSSRIGMIGTVILIFVLSGILTGPLYVYLEGKGKLPGWIVGSIPHSWLELIGLVIALSIAVPVLTTLLRRRKKFLSERNETNSSEKPPVPPENDGAHGAKSVGYQIVLWKFGPYVAIAAFAYLFSAFLGSVLLLILVAYRSGVVSKALENMRDIHPQKTTDDTAEAEPVWKTILAGQLADFLKGGQSLRSRLRDDGIAAVFSLKTDAPVMSPSEKKFILCTSGLLFVLLASIGFNPFAAGGISYQPCATLNEFMNKGESIVANSVGADRERRISDLFIEYDKRLEKVNEVALAGAKKYILSKRDIAELSVLPDGTWRGVAPELIITSSEIRKTALEACQKSR